MHAGPHMWRRMTRGAKAFGQPSDPGAKVPCCYGIYASVAGEEKP